WDYVAVGGLTLGADPVATAIMHAEGRDIDAFVVRKEAKKHGMQRRIEGANVVGQKVLVVEDTTTTGNSPLTAVAALREAGAEVVGVATVVDRATGAADVIAAEGLEYRYLLDLQDLGLYVHAQQPGPTEGNEGRHGVGPWEGTLPDDAHFDPELLANGDRRNVVDAYRYWTREAIVADIDTRRHSLHIAIENFENDANIGTVVRTANAFAVNTVHIVGRRRWNRRGAMVTDRYQH